MKRKFRVNKKVFTILLSLLVIVVILFVASYYFIIAINIPLEIGYKQINLNSGSINMIIPVSGQAQLYIHNFQKPETVSLYSNTDMPSQPLFSIKPTRSFSTWPWQNLRETPFVYNFLDVIDPIRTLGWKEYDNSNFVIKYPPNWDIKSSSTIFINDPKSAWDSHSHSGIIYGHFVSISQVNATNQSAKQYIDQAVLGPITPQSDKNYYSNSSTNLDALNYLSHRISFQRGNIDFEAYDNTSGGRRSFAISNGKLLLTGGGIFGSFDDGSTESLIIRSITFKY